MVTVSSQNDPGLKQLRDLYNNFYNTWQSQKNNIQVEPSAGGVLNLTKLDFDNTTIAMSSFLNSDEAAF